MRRFLIALALVLTAATASAAEINQKLADELNAMRDADQTILKRQIDDPDNPQLKAEVKHVDERRAKIGMAPLAEYTRLLREAFKLKPKS